MERVEIIRIEHGAEMLRYKPCHAWEKLTVN